MRNSVNRRVNCEAANINKTVSAARKQIEDIEYIKSKVENDLKIINYYLEDINLNKPKEKLVFEKTLKKYKCENCKFRLLCNNEID